MLCLIRVTRIADRYQFGSAGLSQQASDSTANGLMVTGKRVIKNLRIRLLRNNPENITKVSRNY